MSGHGLLRGRQINAAIERIDFLRIRIAHDPGVNRPAQAHPEWPVRHLGPTQIFENSQALCFSARAEVAG